ncbi:MAG: hypothetical protein V4547_18835 [Bacteroidota bacterium]
MDQEEIEREIKSLRKMAVRFTEFMLNRAEVDRLEIAFDNGQHKIKESQAKALNEHDADIIEIKARMADIMKSQEMVMTLFVKFEALLQSKGIDTATLKVVR